MRHARLLPLLVPFALMVAACGQKAGVAGSEVAEAPVAPAPDTAAPPASDAPPPRERPARPRPPASTPAHLPVTLQHRGRAVRAR